MDAERSRVGAVRAVLLAAGLAACGSISTASEPASIGPVMSAPATRALASRAVARDPWGDLVDSDGRPVPGPRYLDAIRLEADALGQDLRLQLTVIGAPPAKLRSTEEHDAFVFGLDTGHDKGADYLITFENRPDGSWAASMEDVRSGGRFDGSGIGLSIVFQERVVLVQMPLSEIGSPAHLRVCAISRSARPGDGRVVAQDMAPDGDCRLGTSMVELR